jgi:hypothetical protein
VNRRKAAMADAADAFIMLPGGGERRGWESLPVASHG